MSLVQELYKNPLHLNVSFISYIIVQNPAVWYIYLT